MKKLFVFVAVLLVIVVGAIAALVLLVNPNQFKPLIVEQTKKQTGLELVIDGDISWQFFPMIGFELGKTELRNPAGFSQPNMFKVDRVGIDISVMPLLDNQLHIGQVQLDGAEFYVETLKDGRSNLDSLTQAQSQNESTTDVSPVTESPATAEESSASKGWSINLAGVAVKNARLEIQDHQAGSHIQLYDVQLNVSEFAADNWTTVDFAAKGSNNQQKFGAKGTADIKLSGDFKQYALRNIALDANFSDPATQIDSAKLKLATFEFDKANALTFSVNGKASDIVLKADGSASVLVDQAISKVGVDALELTANLEGQALPQSPMKVVMNSSVAFDMTQNTLSVMLDKLTANALQFDGQAQVTLSDIPKVRFNLHSPNMDLDEFLGLDKAKDSASSQSAQDKASNTAATEEAEPDLSALKTLDIAGDIAIEQFKVVNAKMQNVQMKFAVNRGVIDLNSLTAELYQGKVQATAQVDVRKTPATYQVKKLISGVKVQPLLMDVLDNKMLEGTGNIDVNIQGKSLMPTALQQNLMGTVAIKFTDGAVNGINVAQLIRTSYAKIKGQTLDESEAVKKTDFSAMSTTLRLNKGEVSTSDLAMQSPLLRIHGEGKANYLQQTVDFLVRSSIVGTLTGQDGKDITELRDVTIPINITGQWADPKFRLVFDDVLKQKAQKEIDRGLEKVDEKLKEKIKDEETRQAVDGLLKGLLKR